MFFNSLDNTPSQQGQDKCGAVLNVKAIQNSPNTVQFGFAVWLDGLSRLNPLKSGNESHLPTGASRLTRLPLQPHNKNTGLARPSGGHI